MKQLETPTGAIDLECRLLRLALMSYSEVAEAKELVVPTDAEGLFSGPFLLWKPKSLRLREVRAVAGLSQEAVNRLLMQTLPEVSRTLSPGEVVLFADPDYGVVPYRAAWMLCKGDTEDVKAGHFMWVPRDADDSYNRRSLESRRGWYWTNIYYLQLQNAVVIHAKRNGGKLPTTRAQIAKAVGPENPRAWATPVAMFVEAVLPRMTTAPASPPLTAP
jgi:hypothetical protein